MRTASPGIIRRRLWRWVVLAVVVGCGPPGAQQDEDFLARVGDLKVTRREFTEAFELVKTAYPGSVAGEGEGLGQARLKLLEEMSVELVLARRAEELGIGVSAAEIDAAVDGVKADYPPGVFEQTLIEAAVPFEAWRRRMGMRLMVEKVIEADLRDRIVITAEDVAAYYEQHYRGKAAEADSEEKLHRLRARLVAELKRKKVEEAYGEWVERLKRMYPVEINSRLWEQMTSRLAAAPSPAPAGRGDPPGASAGRK